MDGSSPVARSGLVFGDVLIDENATCHIAWGSGLRVHGSRPPRRGSRREQARLQRSVMHQDAMIGGPTSPCRAWAATAPASRSSRETSGFSASAVGFAHGARPAAHELKLSIPEVLGEAWSLYTRNSATADRRRRDRLRAALPRPGGDRHDGRSGAVRGVGRRDDPRRAVAPGRARRRRRGAP